MQVYIHTCIVQLHNVRLHIIMHMHTCLQAIISYFKERSWVNPSRQVLKRQVTFVEPTNDATAEICVVDKSVDGNIINFSQDYKVCYS